MRPDAANSSAFALSFSTRPRVRSRKTEDSVLPYTRGSSIEAGRGRG